MSIYNYNTHTTKKEVLKILNKLKKDVFDYADYNHYTKYDYNVELTLEKLDEAIEMVETPNKKYGIKHVINKIVESKEDTVYVPSDDWVDEDEN